MLSACVHARGGAEGMHPTPAHRIVAAGRLCTTARRKRTHQLLLPPLPACMLLLLLLLPLLIGLPQGVDGLLVSLAQQGHLHSPKTHTQIQASEVQLGSGPLGRAVRL